MLICVTTSADSNVLPRRRRTTATMSDARDGIEPRRGNFASRKARGETGGCKTSASRSSGKNKEHSYDARRYHQNANRHGIHALRTFDCPVCDSKNTIRVTLNPRLGQGTVTCTYCCSLRPVPTDLPYPSVQAFVPSLENKADVFFRFNEQYAELLQLHMGGHVGGSSDPPSHSAAADSTRKRAGKDDGASDGPTRRPRAEDGLFGDYLPYIDTCLLSNTVDQHVIGATGMLVSDDDGGSDNVVDTNLANPKRVSTPSPPRLDGADAPESNFMSVSMITGVDEAVAEEADVAEFFADSD